MRGPNTPQEVPAAIVKLADTFPQDLSGTVSEPSTQLSKPKCFPEEPVPGHALTTPFFFTPTLYTQAGNFLPAQQMGQMQPMQPMQLMQPMLPMQQIRPMQQIQQIQQIQQFQQFQQVHHFPQFASFGPTNNIPFWHQGTYTNIHPSVQTSSKKATSAKPKYVPLPGVIED